MNHQSCPMSVVFFSCPTSWETNFVLIYVLLRFLGYVLAYKLWYERTCDPRPSLTVQIMNAIGAKSKCKLTRRKGMSCAHFPLPIAHCNPLLRSVRCSYIANTQKINQNNFLNSSHHDDGTILTMSVHDACAVCTGPMCRMSHTKWRETKQSQVRP